MVCSFPRQSDSWVFDGLYRAGKIELEVVPQGNLAERIRAAGAGIGAFFCPTGVGTPLAEGKETRTIDGRDYVLEYPIRGDVALIGAQSATGWATSSTARRPATSGRSWRRRPTMTVAQVSRIVEIGDIDPEAVVTPGIYVDRSSRCDDQHDVAAAIEHVDRGPLDRDELAADRRPRHPGRLATSTSASGSPPWSPTTCDPDSGVVLHTENGMLGMGRPAAGDEIDPDLINAGKVPVTELPGASYFHHADSFAMMRGGHLDVCVWARSRCRSAATSRTGTPARPTRSPPSAARWIWPSAPRRSS